MANALSTIIASVLISVVVGAGLAFVALPAVYPSLQSTSTNQPSTTPTDNETGIVQTVEKKWQDESYIYDNNLNWQLMNKTQISFTIGNNSRILAQFSAPFLLSLDSSFTGMARFEVALVIEGVGNTSVPIIYYDNSASTGNYRQLSFFPTLIFQTGILPAGTYNCTVQWKSSVDAPGANNLSVSHHNNVSAYHYDRWMLLQEIRS